MIFSSILMENYKLLYDWNEIFSLQSQKKIWKLQVEYQKLKMLSLQEIQTYFWFKDQLNLSFENDLWII